MKILFLTQLFPCPPVCGGTIRSYNILRHLGSRNDVTLVSFVRKEPSAEEMQAVSSICAEVKTITIRRSMKANLKFAASSLVKGTPFIVSRDYVPEMQQTVDSLLRDGSFDLLYVDHLQMAQYVSDWNMCPKVLDEHNTEWRIIERIAESEPFGPKGIFASIEAKKLKRWELQTCERFDRVFTVTENDKETLTKENPRLGNVTCIPIGVDLSSFRKLTLDPASRDIVSIATMSWPPNIDSILYFARDIYPRVKSQVGGVRLVIAGSNPPDSISRLQEEDESIVVTGFVEDLDAVASRTAAFIVPLRSGSGLRVKILNALAMGLPVVSTSIGCEGIGARSEHELLVADNAEDFARQVIRLLNDDNMRVRLGKNGRQYIEDNYAWDGIFTRLDCELGEVCHESAIHNALRAVADSRKAI